MDVVSAVGLFLFISQRWTPAPKRTVLLHVNLILCHGKKVRKKEREREREKEEGRKERRKEGKREG